MVREMAPPDRGTVLGIAKKLGHRVGGRGWFSPDAVEKQIPLDILIQRGLVAEGGAGEILGFVTYCSVNGMPYIGWIGVDPDHHGTGVGTALVNHLARVLGDLGARQVLVETPTREAGLGTDYQLTYRFYERAGFEVHRVIPEDSPENKCDCDMAVLKKVIP